MDTFDMNIQCEELVEVDPKELENAMNWAFDMDRLMEFKALVNEYRKDSPIFQVADVVIEAMEQKINKRY